MLELRRIGTGGKILLRRLTISILTLLMICLLAAAIAFPLWALSANAPDFYSWLVISVGIGAGLAYLYSRLKIRLREARKLGKSWRFVAIPMIIRGTRAIGAVLLLVVAISLIATRQFLGAGAAAVAAFLLLAFLVTRENRTQ